MTISTNICKLYEYPDTVTYRADCCCTHIDHSQTITVEYDSELSQMVISIYANLHTKYFPNTYWDSDISLLQNLQTWCSRQFKKVQFIFTVLTKEYIEVEHEFIIETEAAAQDYVEAITTGMGLIKQNLKKNEKTGCIYPTPEL